MMPFPETQKRHVACLEEDSFDVPGDPWCRKRPNLYMFFSGGQKRTENTSTAADEDAADNRQPTTQHNLERGR